MRTAFGLRVVSLVALGFMTGACTGFGDPGSREFDYTAEPRREDPISARVAFWQARQVAEDAGAGAAAAGVGSLGERHDAFVAAERLALARHVVEWAQSVSRTGYTRDQTPYWPTFGELRRGRGDDCDGLELLIYRSLQAFGFEQARLFRAVIEDRTGQLHMVTLWFEDIMDPWVLDPTGMATIEPVPMSELEDWIPRRVFSEDADYLVVSRERP
jgi:hypothetical protein